MLIKDAMCDIAMSALGKEQALKCTSTVLFAPGSQQTTLPFCLTTAHLKSVTPGDKSTSKLQLSPSDHSMAAKAKIDTVKEQAP